MGVISVAGPQFGQRYNVNISGDAPTPEEQERINQFVAQQEATLAQRIEGRFGPTQQVEQPVQQPEEDGGGFGVSGGGCGLCQASGRADAIH